MADYQEYRRRVLHRRWRRRFMAAGLLFLLVLLGVVSVMWKRLHRDPAQTRQDTILQEITEDNTWNTLQYASTRPLTVQTLSTGTTTALDFRMAALPRTAPVEKSWFSQVSFVGDSLTQGMQMYDTGLPGAMFCAYRGVGPNAIVNGTSCKRADGVAEVPLDALTAQQPKAVYLLQRAGHGQRLHQLPHLLPADAGYDHPGAAGYAGVCAVRHPGAAGSGCEKGPRGSQPRPPVPHQR